MGTINLAVDISEELHRDFVTIVTAEEGLWRGKEPIPEAINSAVAAALMLFLQGLKAEKR